MAWYRKGLLCWCGAKRCIKPKNSETGKEANGPQIYLGLTVQEEEKTLLKSYNVKMFYSLGCLRYFLNKSD